jgi:hypothetical protein
LNGPLGEFAIFEVDQKDLLQIASLDQRRPRSRSIDGPAVGA